MQDNTLQNQLLAQTFRGLVPLAERLAQLDLRLEEVSKAQAAAIAGRAQVLRRKIRSFEPTVTVIGQVKAGKTTLLNAMTGRQGLLPSDVNPWTSVVTSVHLKPSAQRRTRNASFRFFSEEEWSGLMRKGGRLGDLANRAGADDEMAKVREQLDHMRDKSRQRLGHRFELLLGQTHDYEAFDPPLVERYVCMGDDFWDEEYGDADQGRFADITRTADLWLDQPELPTKLCLCDTPGVNDTFMIREQITINALRGSKLCVVVLSATQALTSVDLALVRMITNVRSRDVIIFINRIDELANPARDVPEIHESILDTLRKHDGPTDAEIIFGSGLWAENAIEGNVEQLDHDSASSLLSWAEAAFDAQSPYATVEEMVWHLSGVQALGDAISERVACGTGQGLVEEIETELSNLDQSASVSQFIGALPEKRKDVCQFDHVALSQAMAEIAERSQTDLEASAQTLRRDFLARMESSRNAFVDRATLAVVSHLEEYGDLEIWSYDPSSLRALLRSSYQRYVRALTRQANASTSFAAQELAALYQSVFGIEDTQFQFKPPVLPTPDPPVVLGQTIALDLRQSWWSRFWKRRRGYAAFSDDFAKLISEEIQPMLDAMVNENAQRFEASVIVALQEFLSSQGHILDDLLTGDDPSSSQNVPILRDTSSRASA